MNLRRIPLLLGFAVLAFGAVAARAQFVWTGSAGDGIVSNGNNWSGNVAPAGTSGSDSIDLTYAGTYSLNFTAPFTVLNVTLNQGVYDLTGTGPLTLNGDVTTNLGSSGYLFFSAPLVLSANPHNFSLGSIEVAGADVAIFGPISGTGSIVKYGAGSLFIETASNTFTGGVDLREGRLVVHGDGALGTGLITMSGGTLVAADYYNDSHTSVLANDLSLSQTSRFGDYNGLGSLTFTGTATAQGGLYLNTAHLSVSGTGLLTFNNLAETDPSTVFSFEGGTTRITGSANYTGGTQVIYGGVVIFAGSPPATGTLQFPNADGSYIGTEQTTSIATNFLSHIDYAYSDGIIGFDTPNGTPATVNENIDLTAFDLSPNIRLGTATAAVFNGTLTPWNSSFRFGGRGVLTVNSNLVGSGVCVDASNDIQVFLTGTNTYDAGTFASSGGAVVFANIPGALPATGSLTAYFGGYIGQTEATALSASTFLSRFDVINTNGVVGFDAANPLAGRTVSDAIDLATPGFGSGVYIGTSTAATLTGTITPVGTQYRFTGFRDGRLTVNSNLGGSGYSMVVGQEGEAISGLAPTGVTFNPSVTLNGTNTYDGGTTLQSGGLILGNASALGPGDLTISSYTPTPVWLSTNTPGLTIANNVYVSSATEFDLGGSNDFTLSGSFFLGDYIAVKKTGANTVTFSGDNVGWHSPFEVASGDVIFATNTAAGDGGLRLRNSTVANARAFFTSSAPAVGSLSGESDTQLDVGPGILAVSQGVDDHFDGTITGTGGLALFAGHTLFLGGHNTYAGGTFVHSGDLDLNGGSITHALADMVVADGETDSASLTVEKGGTVSSYNGTLGNQSGSSGSASVDGAGSAWANAGSLNVGVSGSGQLTVTNGGAVTAYGTFVGQSGFGSVTVSDSGSSLSTTDEIIVGAFSGLGQGDLAIELGGTVNAGRGSIGYIGNGYVSIDGAGSAWHNTGYLYVGSGGGNAHLNLTNGATLTSNSGEIGLDGAFGNVVLNGTGTHWDVTTGLNVGHNSPGSGVLELLNNAVINVASGTGVITLGNGAGSSGLLMVGESEYSPFGGYLNTAEVTSGGGSAVVQFDTGATKTSPYYFTKDGSAGGTYVQLTGTITVNNYNGYNVLSGTNTYTGGTLLYGGTLVAASNGALGTGTVQFSGGRLSVASGVTLSNPLTFAGPAILGGNGTLGSAVTVGTGVDLAPGNSVGLLTFSSGTTWGPGGNYDVEVQAAGGARGVGYDSIDVTGGLTFNATLGSPFTVNLISLDGSGNPGAVGDFNSGIGYAWLIAHTDGITGFNVANLQVVTTGFTNSIGSGGFYVTTVGNDVYLNFSPVPEPSTWILLGLGLGLGALRCRRRRTAR
ncbi:MAG: PEP-CTERM sorting domain-containing protein [Verrucomicrobia bacterium]|nr:PEP-CTERM sorting domain-containing protein [Verrucomicrobiota bacterium]